MIKKIIPIFVFPAALFSQGWTVQIVAEIDGWGLGGDFIVDDSENYLGVNTTAADGYDDDFDVPEPPPPAGNYIQFYFPHPEWENPFEEEKFTQDIRYENESLLNESGITWNAEIYSEMDGPTTLTFLVIGEFFDCNITVALDGSVYDVFDGDTIHTELNAFVKKPVEINVGNCDYQLSILNTQPVSPLILNAYPNPFNNTVNIEYYVSEPGMVSVFVYDLLGKKIIELKDIGGYKPTGNHSMKWQPVITNSGVYVIKIETETSNYSKQITLLK